MTVTAYCIVITYHLVDTFVVSTMTREENRYLCVCFRVMYRARGRGMVCGVCAQTRRKNENHPERQYQTV